MSVPKCPGCQIDYEYVCLLADKDCHFAGKGLHEKGHLLMIMVNDKGEIVVQ